MFSPPQYTLDWASPFIGPWFVKLHMWPTFRPHGNSPFLLHSWQGNNNIPWYCVGCLCIHHKRCWLTCCVWTNPHSSTSYPLVFILINWHCVFGWWRSHIDQCRHCWPHSNGLDFVCCIVLRIATTMVAQAKKRFYQNQYLARLVYPSHYWGLWVFTSIS
jgi:hypothetical protein